MKNNKLYSSMFIYILLFSIEEKDFFYKFNSEIFKQNYLSILIKLYKQKIIDKDNLLLIVEFISLLSIYERNDFTSNEFPKNRIIKNYKIFKYSLDIIKKTNDIKITKEFDGGKELMINMDTKLVINISVGLETQLRNRSLKVL